MDEPLPNSEASESSNVDFGARPRSAFATTMWGVVLEAGDQDHEKAAVALHQLCSIYWYPIYAFVRRRGSNFHEAEDLTQAFFAHLLEGQLLQKVDQDKGRFRSFLLTALTN